ncbi:NADH dehydrogenase (ubiquinone) 1 beta subcomplex subunit 2 [Paragonimus westermani]|uniref:NADH dehydrogenase (Ubiquinone) 1 beta subcomplex subunit 2 n=2 Tax=Paragonimus westermani TaxID=34504 RepID=A0A5J4NIA6_9TREM|nr:NADH dehydrogenase (ubiquinone) 1 beta subcomplex subunit 2 [Paragonimus westermani]
MYGGASLAVGIAKFLRCSGVYHHSRRNAFYSSKHTLFYRDQVKPDEKLDRLAQRTMLVFWTWFFYQMINEGYTLLGEDVFPDPSTFSDAELGIE